MARSRQRRRKTGLPWEFLHVPQRNASPPEKVWERLASWASEKYNENLEEAPPFIRALLLANERLNETQMKLSAAEKALQRLREDENSKRVSAADSTADLSGRDNSAFCSPPSEDSDSAASIHSDLSGLDNSAFCSPPSEDSAASTAVEGEHALTDAEAKIQAAQEEARQMREELEAERGAHARLAEIEAARRLREREKQDAEHRRKTLQAQAARDQEILNQRVVRYNALRTQLHDAVHDPLHFWLCGPRTHVPYHETEAPQGRRGDFLHQWHSSRHRERKTTSLCLQTIISYVTMHRLWTRKGRDAAERAALKAERDAWRTEVQKVCAMSTVTERNSMWYRILDTLGWGAAVLLSNPTMFDTICVKRKENGNEFYPKHQKEFQAMKGRLHSLIDETLDDWKAPFRVYDTAIKRIIDAEVADNDEASTAAIAAYEALGAELKAQETIQGGQTMASITEIADSADETVTVAVDKAILSLRRPKRRASPQPQRLRQNKRRQVVRENACSIELVSPASSQTSSQPPSALPTAPRAPDSDSDSDLDESRSTSSRSWSADNDDDVEIREVDLIVDQLIEGAHRKEYKGKGWTFEQFQKSGCQWTLLAEKDITNGICFHSNGYFLIEVVAEQECATKPMTDMLKTSTATLAACFLPASLLNSNESTRGIFKVLHICVWRRSQPQPFLSHDAHGSHVQEYLAANAPLFDYVTSLLRRRFPGFVALQSKIRDMLRSKLGLDFLAGSFPGFALNIEAIVKAHKDSNDAKQGICVIIAFGSYSGAQLCFAEAELVVPFPSGHIMIFRSGMLTHLNCSYKGQSRNSIVFFTCWNLISLVLETRRQEIR
ncbi:hypothetical protein HDU87_001747 [Geranomyces variabilis]|uniref:Uncharacterized protein n=1 Tax=Geranomyces variabilis TaxID=109894 RepID=A0AAD5TDB0_9FUNG|nr:hypothetical protein HDU87_001747 [Geranomyces variabilis]